LQDTDTRQHAPEVACVDPSGRPRVGEALRRERDPARPGRGEPLHGHWCLGSGGGRREHGRSVKRASDAPVAEIEFTAFTSTDIAAGSDPWIYLTNPRNRPRRCTPAWQDAQMFERLVETIGNAVGGWLYVIAGGLCFAEAAILVGMVLPGETALLVAGVFCAHHKLNLWVMIVVAFVSAVAGDSVGFEFGKKFGPALRRSRLGRWVGEHRWAMVDGFLHRHGGKAVLLGRLTALFRALVPSMAGMSGMRYRTFLTWNVIGGAIWAPGCVLLGYGFSKSLDVVGKALTWAPLAIVGVVALVYVGLHVRRSRIERAEAAAFAESDSAQDAVAEG
jgi:membrane protein DedA with SNARE-associated domain